jgi:hypothetical protein
MENLVASNIVNPREQNSEVSGLFFLDRMHTSFAEIFGLTRDFVKRKDADSKFVDFYAGGVGTTMIQLMAGHSEYNAYQAITARRECYLFEAQLRSSVVGIASALGYATYRGKNAHLNLTFIPSTNIAVKPFTIIGGIGEYDIVAMEEKSFEYGKVNQIEVVLGRLMQETTLVPTAKTHFFRFYSDKISEDIQLTLKGSIVPYSRDLLSLLKDEFVIFSNPVGGIDVFYLNRFPPQSWQTMARYTYFDYIKPNYSFRLNFTYKVGQRVTSIGDNDYLPIFYECTKAGTTALTEPTWNSSFGSTTTSHQTTWKCIGRYDQPRFFQSITPGIAESGENEPIWPTTLGSQLKEGQITWIAVAEFGASRFPYETGDPLQVTFVEYEDILYTEKELQLDIGAITIVTVTGKFQELESITDIRTNAPLYHETKHIVRGREDYRKLFKQMTPNIVDGNGFDVSPAVVRLTYVKDHTTRVWEPDMTVDVGDMILPTTATTFIYRAATSGHTGSAVRGTTSLTAPAFNATIGGLTEDGQLIWKTLTLNTDVTRKVWGAKQEFALNEYAVVSSLSGKMLQVVGIDTEPVWPPLLNTRVSDNDITWECFDTIFLSGYEAQWYAPGRDYTYGTFVKPALSTGYFYKARNSGVAGNTEPIWPKVICETVIDGNMVWECYDLLNSPIYTKNRVLEQLALYRPFGVEPALIGDPKLVSVHLKISLTTNITKDIQSIKDDVDQVLAPYQRVLAISVEAVDLENILEQSLDYIHVARVAIVKTNKVTTWTPGTLYKVGDVVQPNPPNGYYYKMQLTTLGSQSYSSWTDRSYSSDTEPTWPKASGGRVQEDSITWEMRPTAEYPVTPNVWQPNTIYKLNAAVLPVSASNFYAKVAAIKYTVPIWPTRAGSSVRDNRLFWVCIDPNATVVPLAWNEYYIFTRTFDVKKK